MSPSPSLNPHLRGCIFAFSQLLRYQFGHWEIPPHLGATDIADDNDTKCNIKMAQSMGSLPASTTNQDDKMSKASLHLPQLARRPFSVPRRSVQWPSLSTVIAPAHLGSQTSPTPPTTRRTRPALDVALRPSRSPKAFPRDSPRRLCRIWCGTAKPYRVTMSGLMSSTTKREPR